MTADGADASLHLAIVIERPWQDVHALAGDPRNLPRWAAGLAGSEVRRKGPLWVTDSPMGQVLIDFTAPNAYGVMDHTVTLPTGESVLNPLRVMPLDEGSCEVVFSLRRRDMTDDELAADATAVRADLASLKQLCEQEGAEDGVSGQPDNG